MAKTVIVVDAFGGDNCPLAPLKGAADAVKELDVEIILTGSKNIIEDVAAKEGISLEGITIEDAATIMPMEAEPTKLLKQYKDSSMAVAFNLLAEGRADAFVSAGSTGAVTVGATFIAKRIKGVKRPAIACVIPNSKSGYMLLDCGANSECRPEMLRQFAIMGSIYMKKLFNLSNPSVGLVNIGTEDTKGTPLQQETNELLKNTEYISYCGNVEARSLPLGGCDVAVCDGFTGNVILKLTEGMGKMMKDEIKHMFMANLLTKLGAVMVSGQLKGFKNRFDYKSFGGAMLLGVKKPVIKAHGSSDARAFKNAIKQAKTCYETNIIKSIEDELAKIKLTEEKNETAD